MACLTSCRQSLREIRQTVQPLLRQLSAINHLVVFERVWIVQLLEANVLTSAASSSVEDHRLSNNSEWIHGLAPEQALSSGSETKIRSNFCMRSGT